MPISVAPAAAPRILHLSIDYNNPYRASTTTAIEWFVDELKSFDNVVVSMVRKAEPNRTYFRDCGQLRNARVFAYGYFGLPFGIGLFWSMWLAARRIRAELDRHGIRPDVIHAHKLGFEGLSGWLLARWYKIPFVVSLRGEVETKIFRRKPTYRGLLRRIARDASRIYHVSAWFRDEFHRHVGVFDTERLLPNIVRNTQRVIRSEPANDRFITVMNLDILKKKGLPTLLEGFRRAAIPPNIQLDVVGQGSSEARTEAEELARRLGLESRVNFLGKMDNAELLLRMRSYRAFLLPSENETFGMAYIEALFAGIPILYTRGTGIDGYLDGLNVGISVSPRNGNEVGAAIERLDGEVDAFRIQIETHAAELYRRFNKETIVESYKRDMEDVLSKFGRPEKAIDLLSGR